MRSHPYDAIIVGGGFAGVTAARELRRAGLVPLILEARDRLGGRTWTKNAEGAVGNLEIGGTWVHWHQPHVWAEITRYQLPVVEDMRMQASTAYMPQNGAIAQCDVGDAMQRMGRLWARYFEHAREVFPAPYSPLAAEERVKVADQLSYRERLDELDLAAEDREWLATVFDVGLAHTHIMHWWALAAYEFQNYFDILLRFRLAGGTRDLLNAILAEAGATIRLECPVVSVETTDGAVEVTTATGETFAAPRAIIAIQPRVWTSITWSPGLSDVRLAADEPWRVGRTDDDPHYGKGYVRLDGVDETFFAWPPAGSGFKWGWTYKRGLDGSQIVVLIGLTDVASAVETLSEMHPRAEIQVVAEKDWNVDPYTQCVTWNPAVSVLSTVKPHETLPEPQGRVVFANSDFAHGWAGFIEGAIESGMRGGRRAAAMR